VSDDNKRLGFATAPWWRFKHYEIVDGVVRPTSDSEAEPCDPWQDYLDARRRGTGEGRMMPPYQELIDLWHSVRSSDLDGSYSVLDSRQEKRLLEWCGRHGLLGLWHHQVLLAAFPDGSQRSDGLRLRGYQRAPGGWREVAGVTGRDKPRTQPRGPHLTEEYVAALPREIWHSALPAGGFIVRELASGAISQVPLRSEWRLYFDPDGPLGEPAWPLPSPTSHEFWRAYGEPVAMIMFAAQELEFAIEHLAAGGAEGQASLEKLNALAAPTAPGLVETADGLTMGWDSPSLLSNLAMMAISDASGGARPLVCQACGAPFLTKSYQTLYCSNRCKETARTRRRRDKEKAL
jgi:hypothetical protein